MKSFSQKLAIALALLVANATAFAQNYPNPGSDTAPPVKCTGCPGSNSSGQKNDGLNTWPYSDPIARHVGRFVDSTSTRDYQQPFRTARARKAIFVKTANAGVPPRAYIQIGSAVGIYSLDRFFTQILPGGLVTVGSAFDMAINRTGTVPEEAAPVDAYIYPESSGSGWTIPGLNDGQDRLTDFDVDDRGHVYVSTGSDYGWGITKDSGQTSGGSLRVVQGSQVLQMATIGQGENAIPIIPLSLVVVKAGSSYFVVVGDTTNGRAVYDVTNPAAPSLFRTKVGGGFLWWSKDDAHGRVAIVNADREVEIYDNAAFANNGGPIEAFTARTGKQYKHITVDENGNFWTVEVSKVPADNKLIKFERSGNGYVQKTFDVFGGPFSPDVGLSEASTINYGDRLLAVVGMVSPGGNRSRQVRIFKIENGQPLSAGNFDFFNKYYYNAPENFAQPGEVGSAKGAFPIKWGNKTYLVYSANGLGDVYELETGGGLTVTQKSGLFGTTNPNAKSTASGPYYGDIYKFHSATAPGTVDFDVNWNFDNGEAGSDNTQAARTGQDIQYQFSGLDTVGEINTVRHVRATAAFDSSTTDSVDVALKVPTARIGIDGTDVVATVDGSSLTVIAGDELTDASDGTVEGHYAAWTLDGAAPVSKEPDETIPVGDVGPHTVTLAARYGKYNASFVTTGPAFVDTVSNISYEVRPFAIAFGTPSTSGNTVTFKATSRRTSLTSVLSSATWTVEWSLKDGGSDVVSPVSSTVTIGQIPDFPVADKGAIPSGSILRLKVSVPTAALGVGVPVGYAEHVISQTLITPDPKITKSGCANVGSPCSFTMSSVTGNPTTDWSIAWTLKRGTTTVSTATKKANEAFTPTLTDSGSHTVSAKATTQIFEGNATLPSFDVAAPICGNPPSSSEVSIFASCTQCSVGQKVRFAPDSLTYRFEDCEEYSWTFGDGGTLNTSDFEIEHTYSRSGTFTARLTIKKGSQSSPQYTLTIRVGGGDDGGGGPGPQPCAAPTNIQIDYDGNRGCRPGTPCQVGESVKFTAFRGLGPLISCDDADWTFGDNGSSTATSPSHVFTAQGNYTVNVTVNNTSGQATKSVSVPVVAAPSGTCGAPPTANDVEIDFLGAQSGCNPFEPNKLCRANEQIKFTPRAFLGYTIQDCVKYEWNFGDNSGLSTLFEPTHSYAGTAASYRVSLRVHNTTNATGNTLTVNVPFSTAPVLPQPVLNGDSFPGTGSKGVSVTFTATSNISATGWAWDFGDGQKDNTQSSAVGTSNTVTHTYANKGTYSVSVKARNSQDTTSAPVTTLVKPITIDETPEFKYLIPVVAHAGGIGSVWRTDLQIYTPDPNVSPANPLLMTATFQGVNYPLSIPKPTFIYEDILDTLLLGKDAQGSMIITVKTQHLPQIWSRTYNQTDAGTFGQFIPAILLNTAGGGGAIGEGNYYLPGLRSGPRYRTNVGLVNPNAQKITAIVRLYDEDGLPIGSPTPHPLEPFALDQFPVSGVGDEPFSVEVEVPAGSWLIGYASLIDGGSSDPIYLQAIRESELGSADFRDIVIPGVGHVGAWRSDVTIYNPNSRTVTVDLTYYDGVGAKKGEALHVPIGAGQFLQYGDILKQGVFGDAPDGVGMLRVIVPATITADFFPLAFARTYNDNGSGKTYGQGIPGFAVARANVKPGKVALIPAVRSSDKYYTNVGITNVSSSPIKVTVKVLDPNTGAEVGSQTYDNVAPNQSIVQPEFNLHGRANASLKIEVVGGNAWVFASVIDRGTLDPEYVAATQLP